MEVKKKNAQIFRPVSIGKRRYGGRALRTAMNALSVMELWKRPSFFQSIDGFFHSPEFISRFFAITRIYYLLYSPPSQPFLKWRVMWTLYPLLFLAGFIDSIAGGGGLISLTSYLAAGVPPHLALGTNKFSAFLGTGLSAACFARKGHVEWRSAAYSLVGALIGAAAGARIALHVEEKALALILVILIPAAAAVILLKRDLGSAENRPAGRRFAAYAFLAGLGIGAYDGFFGPGTGTFLIMAFTLITGLNLLTACGNTKVVNFASNIAAVATFVAAGDVDYRLGIPCALCCILGNFVGTRLAIKNGVRIVRPMMLTVVTLLLIKVAADLW